MDSDQESVTIADEMHQEYERQDRLAEDLRWWISPEYSINKWKEVLDALGIIYKERSRGTGTLYSLCVFHMEKSASLCFSHSGSYVCYGCRSSGDIAKFILTQTVAEPSQALGVFATPPSGLADLETKISEFYLKRSARLDAEVRRREEFFSKLELGEEPF